MSDQSYKSPPITEAVIEIRFAAAIDAADVDKASADFTRFYRLQQALRSVDFALGVPPALQDQPTAQFHQQIGHRRSSEDLSEILLLWPTTFVVAQLAPYPGWDSFFGRFVRDWKIWKSVEGYRRILRVGVRFINRIDVPFIPSKAPTIEESEYLNVYPHLPDSLGPVTGYGVQAQLPILDMGCKLTINSAVVPSPMLSHSSFLLDIDIAMDGIAPQNDEDMYELLNRIRIKKNSVFEACITNRARELFQK